MCLFIMHCTTPERIIIFFGIPLVNFRSPESQISLDKSDVVTQRHKKTSTNLNFFGVDFGFRAIQFRFFFQKKFGSDPDLSLSRCKSTIVPHFILYLWVIWVFRTCKQKSHQDIKKLLCGTRIRSLSPLVTTVTSLTHSLRLSCDPICKSYQLKACEYFC